MANRPYLKGGLQHFAAAGIDWTTDNIKVALCSSSYTPDTSATGDEFLAVIPGGAIVATSGNLASTTNAGGTLDAADVTFTAISGSVITQYVVYKDTGSSATSPLLFLFDTATNLPLTPNGGNIVLQFPGSPNYIATL